MRLRPWQQAALFTIGLGGAVFMLVAPYVDSSVVINPAVVTIFGGIIAFVLTGSRSKDDKDDKGGEDR